MEKKNAKALRAEELEIVVKRDDMRISLHKEIPDPAMQWQASGHLWTIMGHGIAASRLTDTYGDDWSVKFEADPVDSAKTLCLLTINGVTRTGSSLYGNNAAFNEAAKLFGIGEELYSLPPEGVPFRCSLTHIWANKGRIELFHKLKVTRFEVTENKVTALDVRDAESNDPEPIAVYRATATETEPKAEPKAESKAELKAEPKAEAKTEVKPKAETKAKPKAEPKVKAESKAESEPKPKPKPTKLTGKQVEFLMNMNMDPEMDPGSIRNALEPLSQAELEELFPVCENGGKLTKVGATFGALSQNQLLTVAKKSPSPMTKEILARLEKELA